MAMEQAGEFRSGMPFFGGRLWLDLLNSRLAYGDVARDFVAEPDSLPAWLAAAGIRAGERPSTLDQHALTELRETLRTALDPLRLGHPLPEKIVNDINRCLADVCVRFRLDRAPDGTAHLVETLDTGRSGAAGAIAADFSRFVCDYEPERLKRCSNPACTMVFYDQGKNSRRRWCTMSICGNRNKVARFRAKGRSV